MTKNSMYASIGFTLVHRSIHSGVKRCFALMTALLAIILLGVLVTSCGIYFGNGPPSSSTQPPASTSLPDGGSRSPIAEGDFLNSPGPITGPAIVEFWNGQSGANDVCGTFQLPSGESFSWSPAGHWWKYKSDQDMQAEWPLHLALYNQKSENAPCTRGQRPPA